MCVRDCECGCVYSCIYFRICAYVLIYTFMKPTVFHPKNWKRNGLVTQPFNILFATSPVIRQSRGLQGAATPPTSASHVACWPLASQWGRDLQVSPPRAPVMLGNICLWRSNASSSFFVFQNGQTTNENNPVIITNADYFTLVEYVMALRHKKHVCSCLMTQFKLSYSQLQGCTIAVIRLKASTNTLDWPKK